MHIQQIVLMGCVMTEAVSYWFLTAEVQVHSQNSAYGICDRQSGTGIDFSPKTSFISCQYHFTAVPYLPTYHLGDRQCAR
jgi:hypothetical protein